MNLWSCIKSGMKDFIVWGKKSWGVQWSNLKIRHLHHPPANVNEKRMRWIAGDPTVLFYTWLPMTRWVKLSLNFELLVNKIMKLLLGQLLFNNFFCTTWITSLWGGWNRPLVGQMASPQPEGDPQDLTSLISPQTHSPISSHLFTSASLYFS